MKNSFLWAAGLLVACVMSVLAQLPGPSQRLPAGTPIPQQQSGELTRFSLDFPGGTPKELVAAIQKAMGKPLNAIVPDEYAEIKIPALKMSNVNVGHLFAALEQASRKTHAHENVAYYGIGNLQQVTTSYGFQPGPGPLTDDTIWYFRAEYPPMPSTGGTGAVKAVRFYALDPYLRVTHGDRHLTVDDITTAIETGWKMLGETSPPKISFHKDTNLLIAVGEPNKLEIIDAVLKALTPQPAPAATEKAAAPRPAESPRSAESSNSGSE